MADPLSPRELDELSAALRAMRDELEQQAGLIEPGTRPVQLDQQAVGRVSRIDAIAQQEMNTARQQHGAEQLRRVLVALSRVESGDYGYCQGCDEPIGLPRLQARPETALCLACQQQREAPSQPGRKF